MWDQAHVAPRVMMCVYSKFQVSISPKYLPLYHFLPDTPTGEVWPGIVRINSISLFFKLVLERIKEGMKGGGGKMKGKRKEKWGGRESVGRKLYPD